MNPKLPRVGSLEELFSLPPTPVDTALDGGLRELVKMMTEDLWNRGYKSAAKVFYNLYLDRESLLQDRVRSDNAHTIAMLTIARLEKLVPGSAPETKSESPHGT